MGSIPDAVAAESRQQQIDQESCSVSVGLNLPADAELAWFLRGLLPCNVKLESGRGLVASVLL